MQLDEHRSIKADTPSAHAVKQRPEVLPIHQFFAYRDEWHEEFTIKELLKVVSEGREDAEQNLALLRQFDDEDPYFVPANQFMSGVRQWKAAVYELDRRRSRVPVWPDWRAYSDLQENVEADAAQMVADADADFLKMLKITID